MTVNSKTITLTEAQIEGLYSGAAVPFTVLAAPRTGEAIVVTSAQLWKTAGNAASAGTTNINISYGTSTTAVATFASVNASAGAMGDNAQNRVQNATLSNANAVAAAGQSVNISASAAIAAATGTVCKLSIDFIIKKL